MGRVNRPAWCSDGHILFAMRKFGSSEYIDPSRYMEQRELKAPEWIQECDQYIFVWLVNNYFSKAKKALILVRFSGIKPNKQNTLG